MKNFVRTSLCALAISIFGGMTVNAQNITTVAGGGPPATTTTGITRLTASVGAPQAVRKDSAGNFYILDNQFSRVYKVDLAGNLTLFAGNGTIGFSGEGGLAINAAMLEPSGMCIDSADNIYVADSDNAIVREIPATPQTFPFAMTAGHIYTVAGTQETNFTYGGDGLLATAAGVHLHFPDGCSVDSHGNLFIADRGNNAIRVVIGQANVPPAGLAGPTVAGHIYLYTGSTGAVPPAPPALGFGAEGSATVGAALNGPFDVFVDPHDNVFIADLGNDNTVSNEVVREVPATAQTFPFVMVAGHIYTVAGTKQTSGPATSGGVATAATLNGPKGIFVDASGNLYFADNGNEVIREVAGPTPNAANAGMTAGHIYNIAGNASAGFSGDTQVALTASINHPNGTFVDSTGQVFISDTQNDRVRLVTSTTGSYLTETIDTWAGNGVPSFSDATTALNGQLDTPAGIAIDAAGDLLIADVGLFGGEQSLIRKVANPISTGALTTLVGSPGFNGFVNDNTGRYPNYVENDAAGVTSDAAGNVYIADTKNCIIRKLSAGVMTTVAGVEPTLDLVNPPNSTPNCGFAAQGGAAVGTRLGAVNSVALNAAGDIFFSDVTNNMIWEVPKNTVGTMTAGNAYVIAGVQDTTGSFGGEAGAAVNAHFNKPTGVYVDVYGNLFIADTGNNIIREIPADNTSGMTAGFIYTVAGDMAGQTAGYSGDNGVATSATLNAPFTMVVDNAENIFIADTNNHVIREVPGVTVGAKTKGNIYTVAGKHVAGFTGDGGAATAAELNFPQGLAIDGAGNLLIGDSQNNRVRSVAAIANLTPVPIASFDKSSLTFTAQPIGIKSTAQVVTLTNNGGSALSGIAITITGADAALFADTTTCTATLAAGANCTISVTFTPIAVGVSSAAVSIADNAIGSPQTITLSGTGQNGVPTDTLTPNPLAFTPQPIGVPSAAIPVTVSNATGTGPLVITGITFGGANGSDFSQTNNCGTLPATVAVGATCTINVVFNPTSATPAARTATLTLADNATNGSINITGTVTAAALTLNLGAASGGSLSQTVTAGATATYMLQISANQNATVTFACTGAPTAATCTAPVSVPVTGGAAPAAVSVTVSTTARGMLAPQSEPTTRMQPPAAIQMLPLSVLATLLLIVTLLAATQSPAGRLRVARVALSACLVLMPIMAATLLGGCGGGSSSTPPPPVTGTPAGTYTVTVTATSGSATATTKLTLIVQ
jgi:sugar lactone lactonase YvrE